MSEADGTPHIKERLSGAFNPFGAIKRIILIMTGTAAVILAVVGIFLPVLPTTPFLLLAAACYAASSKRFYSWLLSNRLFGAHLKNYREGRGLSIKVKIGTLSMMWAMMGMSIFLFVVWLPLKLLLLGIAAAVSVHVLKLRSADK